MLLFHDCQLYDNDLDSLRPRKWITDNIIEYHCELLEKEIFQGTEIFEFVRPAIFYLITSSSLSNSELLNMFSHFKSRNILFFPINDGINDVQPLSGTHWSLLVYTRAENTFYYYDSMGAGGIEWIARKSIHAIQGVIVAPSTPSIKIINILRQDNGYDCGGYVMRITFLLAQRLQDRGYDLIPDPSMWEISASQITAKEIALYREYLFIDISKRAAKYKK